MNMKKCLALLLCVVLLLAVFAGCADQAATPEKEDSSAPANNSETQTENNNAGETQPEGENTGDVLDYKDIVVAGIVFKDDYFMQMLQKGYEDAAADLGVTLYTANSNRDVSTEQQLVYSYMDMGVQGIAIAPYLEEASRAVLEDAHNAGLEIAITNLDLVDAPWICGGVTSGDYENGYALGQFSAEHLINKYGTPLKLAIMEYNATLPLQSLNRVNGFLDGLKDAGAEYEIVAQQSTTSSQDNVSIAEAMLTGAPEANVFYTISTSFTSSTCSAIVNMGLNEDDITVIGYDMNDQIAEFLMDDAYPIYCTVEQDAYNMGYNAIIRLVAALRGEVSPDDYGKTEFLAGGIHSREDLDEVQEWLDYYYSVTGQ